MAGNLEPQDCYSANALMSLGGRDLGPGEGNGNGTSASMTDLTTQQANMMATDAGHLGGATSGGIGQWPLNIFDIGHGGVGS